MSTTIIKPTIGRRVWFRPSDAFLERSPTVTQLNRIQPMDAGIVYVHHEHMVNLSVCDHVGRTHMVRSVPLIAGQWEPSDSADFCVCEWMPYQQAQARKEADIARVVSMNTPLGAVAAPIAAAQAQSAHPAIAAMQPLESDGKGLDLNDDTPLAPACDLSADGACEACQ